MKSNSWSTKYWEIKLKMKVLIEKEFKIKQITIKNQDQI
jgi:hypothetical protein